jgi:hypothetical protein
MPGYLLTPVDVLTFKIFSGIVVYVSFFTNREVIMNPDTTTTFTLPHDIFVPILWGLSMTMLAIAIYMNGRVIGIIGSGLAMLTGGISAALVHWYVPFFVGDEVNYNRQGHRIITDEDIHQTFVWYTGIAYAWCAIIVVPSLLIFIHLVRKKDK